MNHTTRLATGRLITGLLAMAFAMPTQSGAQTLTIAVRAGPESIDPHFTATGTHAEALKHVFDTLTWSGEYDIPVRFDTDWLQIGHDGGLLQWQGVTLVETRL